MLLYSILTDRIESNTISTRIIIIIIIIIKLLVNVFLMTLLKSTCDGRIVGAETVT